MQRAARAALQCCCRSLHSQVNTFQAAPDSAGALSILRLSSRALRDAIPAERLACQGTVSARNLPSTPMTSQQPHALIAVTSLSHADAPSRGAFLGAASLQSGLIPSAGQIASMLQMSQLHRAKAEADQPVRKALLSFLEHSSEVPMYADSVRRKRKTKMNKHKHRKRLKKMRHGSK